MGLFSGCLLQFSFLFLYWLPSFMAESVALGGWSASLLIGFPRCDWRGFIGVASGGDGWQLRMQSRSV